MVLGKLHNIKKYYGDRLILDIDDFEILENDRVGIVGRNGVGKTTLLKVLIGEIQVEDGQAIITDSYSYISQKEDYNGKCYESKAKSLFHAPDEYEEFLSGGEKVKIRIAQALGGNTSLIIADEPTANLDEESVKKLEEMLNSFKGSLLLVSHDREFINKLCNKIIELDEGKIYEYKGNYDKYLQTKEENKKRKEKEYHDYKREKARLEEIILTKEGLRDRIKKAPKGMGKSEAKTIKMGDQAGKKTLDNNIKSIKNKIEHLEVKEKPKSESKILIKIPHGKEIVSSNIVEIKNFDLEVHGKKLLKNISLKIKNGKKVALIGENGSGKTTLVKAIIENNNEKIVLSQNVVIGYFEQNQNNLNDEKSILENIMEDSSYDESFIRIILAEFGIKGEAVYKKVKNLSGGEKVKVAICKVILFDNNFLILDEPTNYLDIKSMEALEEALIETEKTVLLISHDRRLIENVCNYIIKIENSSIIEFDGTYKEFINEKNKSKLSKSERKNKDELLVLENRLSDIVFSISIEQDINKKADLDKEYNILLKKIQKLK